jgi:glycosyltransferase involved in cell wall biosynthesis
MKVGILGHGFIGWRGGVDFLRMIAENLNNEDPNIELHFLFPMSGPIYRGRLVLKGLMCTLSQIMGHKCTKRSFNIKDLEDFASTLNGNLFFHLIDFGNSAIRKATNKYQLDVILPSIKPLVGQRVPWVGYIYDYQHAYFPEFFSQSEIDYKAKQFASMLASTKFVLVNGQAVAEDVKRFNPESTAKIFVLPFSAAPKPSWLDAPPPNLDKYRISGRYFIISNQFWQHKNHITAFRAIAIVLRFYPDIELVCTGETHDYRKPEYFHSLKESAKKLRINHRLHILGLVPKIEQISLIRAAIAMVQPSLFEGGPGGGAVFDAISLGVPCIVSDIKINIELNDTLVDFFKAGDHKSLARKMIEILETDPAQLRKSRETILSEGRVRSKKCGQAIIEMINEVIDFPDIEV